MAMRTQGENTWTNGLKCVVLTLELHLCLSRDKDYLDVHTHNAHVCKARPRVSVIHHLVLFQKDINFYLNSTMFPFLIFHYEFWSSQKSTGNHKYSCTLLLAEMYFHFASFPSDLLTHKWSLQILLKPNLPIPPPSCPPEYCHCL